jgi:hypothetical protein
MQQQPASTTTTTTAVTMTMAIATMGVTMTGLLLNFGHRCHIVPKIKIIKWWIVTSEEVIVRETL